MITIFEKTNGFLFLQRAFNTSPSVERNTSQIHPLWKIPRLVGSVVLAMVMHIVINYAIGGFLL